MCACQARLPEASKAKPGRACFASVVRRGAGCAGDGAAARCTLHAARRKLGGGGGLEGACAGGRGWGAHFAEFLALRGDRFWPCLCFDAAAAPHLFQGWDPGPVAADPSATMPTALEMAQQQAHSRPQEVARGRGHVGALSLRRLLYPPDARHSFLTRAAVVRLTNVIARVRLACCVTTQALCGAVEAHGDGCEQPSEAGRRSRRRSQSSPRLLLNILVHPSSTCLQWTQGRAR